jgi:hypothetical protein
MHDSSNGRAYDAVAGTDGSSRMSLWLTTCCETAMG